MWNDSRWAYWSCCRAKVHVVNGKIREVIEDEGGWFSCEHFGEIIGHTKNAMAKNFEAERKGCIEVGGGPGKIGLQSQVSLVGYLLKTVTYHKRSALQHE